MRLRFRVPSRGGPLVLDAQERRIRVEGADHLGLAGELDCVAVIAHWAPIASISRSVFELARGLVGHGYQVALASTADTPDPLIWPGEKPPNVTVLRRPNVGYDFGSWAATLDRYPCIAAADQVLFMNDSLVGPFQPMDHLLRHFDASGADVWGLTDTSQFGHHIQSYCLGFKKKCLQEPSLARFWRGIRVERSREDVIWNYEIGLSRLLHREPFSIDAAIRHGRVVRDAQNPTIIGWRRLLDLGFPFVKRQLLRQPEVAPDGSMVRDEIRRRFGVEVDGWL